MNHPHAVFTLNFKRWIWVWISGEKLVNFRWISCKFPVNVLWISRESSVNFPWISREFPVRTTVNFSKASVKTGVRSAVNFSATLKPINNRCVFVIGVAILGGQKIHGKFTGNSRRFSRWLLDTIFTNARRADSGTYRGQVQGPSVVASSRRKGLPCLKRGEMA